MVAINILLGSVVVSVAVSSVLTYLLTVKQIKETSVFKKKFEYFILISKKLEKETQEYFLLIRELAFFTKNAKKTIDSFASKLDFHEKSFGYNNLVLFDSDATNKSALEYFNTISKIRGYVESYPEKKLDKLNLLSLRQEMMENMHKLLKALKIELRI